jgi:hypothetical chaperone protein
MIAEPTLLFYRDGDIFLESFVGKAAIDAYISSGMRGRFFQAIKTVLPDRSFTHTVVNGRKLTIEELVAAIIRHFKTAADKITGMNVDEVICGRPATFGAKPDADATAERRLREALKLAGFNKIHFQLEPIAAAYHYETTLSAPQTVLVGDFGGGTSDFTVMRVDPKKIGQPNRASDILCTSGVAVAGNRFDSAIMRERLLPAFGGNAHYRTHRGARPLSARNYAHAAICEWDKIHHLKSDKRILEYLDRMVAFSDDAAAFKRLQTLITKNLGYALFKKIEAAKIKLSTADRADLIFDDHDLILQKTLLRENILTDAESEIIAIKNCFLGMLAAHSISPAGIDAVFLTGGTAQIPAIRAIFEEHFGGSKIHSGDYFTSIVDGLALSAAGI